MKENKLAKILNPRLGDKIQHEYKIQHDHLGIGILDIQDGAEYGRRVASSGNTLQFFVCFIC